MSGAAQVTRWGMPLCCPTAWQRTQRNLHCGSTADPVHQALPEAQGKVRSGAERTTQAFHLGWPEELRKLSVLREGRRRLSTHSVNTQAWLVSTSNLWLPVTRSDSNNYHATLQKGLSIHRPWYPAGILEPAPQWPLGHQKADHH